MVDFELPKVYVSGRRNEVCLKTVSPDSSFGAGSRSSEGNWYQYLTLEGYRVVRFGLPTDFPVPGDYDSDGRPNIAVFREGVWYLLQSTAGLRIENFGVSGDLPVAVRYYQ